MCIRDSFFTSSVLILCLFHISLFRESVASLRIDVICRDGEFQCKNKICVKASYVCDTFNDCGDRSDEEDCHKPCSWNEFECRNSRCISKYYVCNRINDCGDNSDEMNCGWRDDTDDVQVVSKERSSPIALPIILSSVAAAGIVLVLTVLSIACCVIRRKKNNQPTNSSPSELQQPPPPASILGRMRQSFRTHHQPTAPPLEIVSSDESVLPQLQTPSPVIDRIGQPLSSNPQPTSQAVNTTPASDLRSENTQVPPTIYPHLPPAQDFQGGHIPEFKFEE